MVHLVKGRQYSTSHINTGTSITEMESDIDSRPRQGQISMLQSQEMNSTDRSWHDARYHECISSSCILLIWCDGGVTAPTCSRYQKNAVQVHNIVHDFVKTVWPQAYE